MNGTKQVAQRIVNAENNFIDTVITISHCSEAEAAKVLGVYRKVKAIKLDPIIGRYIVKHGGFMEKEVIERAINS